MEKDNGIIYCGYYVDESTPTVTEGMECNKDRLKRYMEPIPENIQKVIDDYYGEML